MNKKYKIILITLLLIILAICIFKTLDERNKSNITITKESDNSSQTIDLSYETRTLSPSDLYVKFDVTYPYFKQASEEFNSIILNLLEEQIVDNKNTSTENWQARYQAQSEDENISEYPTDDEKFYFSSSFDVAQNNSDYISFILTSSGYTGGAHGYEIKTAFNYDVINQKIISLKDIFSDYPNYLNYISEESRKILKGQYATVTEEDRGDSESEEAVQDYIDNMNEMIDSGTEPTEDNFKNFTFTSNKIKIYFAQYQVGPYAIGEPEVELERR